MFCAFCAFLRQCGWHFAEIQNIVFELKPFRNQHPLTALARELALQVDRLKFAAPIAHVYNPLIYAWSAHEEYLLRFGGGRKRVVFLGMNPGPFGMVQTGIPFGEVAAVRNWLKISAPIGRP